jgi:hypothetical protein
MADQHEEHRSETVVIASTEPLKALEFKAEEKTARVGAYAVRFSEASEKDLSGEYFTSATWFGKNEGNGADVLLNHGEPLGDAPFLKKLADFVFESAKSIKDDIGIFMETVLDLSDEFQKAVFELVQAGKLSWSTGSASHVVKKAKDGQILRWPIVEVSFTPMPCEPRLPAITPLKSVTIPDDIKAEMKAALETKTSGLSADEIRSAVQLAAQDDARFNQPPPDNNMCPSGIWITDIYLESDPKTAVISTNDGKYFEVSFAVDANGKATLGTDAKEVVRKLEYVPESPKSARRVDKPATRDANRAPAPTDSPHNTMSDENKDTKNTPEPVDLEAARKKWQKDDADRKSAIRAEAKQFEKTAGVRELVETALDNGTSVEDFRKSLISQLRDNANSGPEIRVVPDEARKGAHQMPAAAKSVGAAFVESDSYKGVVGKSIGAKRGVAIELPDADVKATLLTSTGPFTSYERPPGPILLEQQRLTIRDLLAQGTTNANSLRIVQEDTYTNAANTVAEEGSKPEASWDLSEYDMPIRKIAVLGRVSDESFDDFPFLQTYVDSRLRFMLKEREEAQLLNGLGSGSTLTGILQTSGIQTQALGSDTRGDAIFKAIFDKVSAVGHFDADGVVMHPTDYSSLRREKDANNQYYGGGMFTGPYGAGSAAVMRTVWGLPCVVTTAIAAGTALVGAFKLGAMIFDRLGIRVDTTNSDASDFQYNRIAIRVEERLGLAVFRPLAFCKVTGL